MAGVCSSGRSRCREWGGLAGRRHSAGGQSSRGRRPASSPPCTGLRVSGVLRLRGLLAPQGDIVAEVASGPPVLWAGRRTGSPASAPRPPSHNYPVPIPAPLGQTSCAPPHVATDRVASGARAGQQGARAQPQVRGARHRLALSHRHWAPLRGPEGAAGARRRPPGRWASAARPRAPRARGDEKLPVLSSQRCPCLRRDLSSAGVMCFAAVRTGFRKGTSSPSSPASRGERLSFPGGGGGEEEGGGPGRSSQGGVGADGAVDSRPLACQCSGRQPDPQ